MTTYAAWETNRSDIRLIRIGSVLSCVECSLSEGWSRDYYTKDITQMLDHMDLHTSYAHLVPAETFVRLRGERDDDQELTPEHYE